MPTSVDGEIGRATFLCTICGKEFQTHWGMKRHEAGHSNAQQLVCSICCLTFATKGHYEGHMNVHLKNKPHICTKCNKGYSYRSALLRHAPDCSGQVEVDVHKNVQYNCETCFATFNRKDTLRDHIGRHTGERRYTCEKCNKKFIWRSGCRRHSKTCQGPKATGDEKKKTAKRDQSMKDQTEDGKSKD